MRTLRIPAQENRRAARQVILLPPAYAEPEDFLRAGFAEAVRARGLDLDLNLVAPELTHVTDRTFMPLIDPLVHCVPKCSTWLGGVSLGAYLALAYAERTVSELEGLLLLAPYLGSYLTVTDISRTGLAGWHAPEGDEVDEEHAIWRLLKHWPDGVALHLGLGLQDRYGTRHRVLAQALSSDQVDAVSGAHDWPTWRRLWDNFLDVRFSSRA
jgi:alpha-beta hydrolase superfamily lysophospholipase